MNTNNTIIITTTLTNNKISEKRRNNLVRQFSTWGFPILFNPGITDDTLDKTAKSYLILQHMFESYKKYNSEYAIICDDDFYPIDNFVEELNKTIDLLPNHWRSLHLCPGYLWGRSFRDKSKISKLNPEYNMKHIPYDSSGRFYINCDSHLYTKKHFWLGGPIAILVNKKHISSFIDDFTYHYKKDPNINDVILTNILTSHDYICRNPILGYEKEEGGSTFKKTKKVKH